MLESGTMKPVSRKVLLLIGLTVAVGLLATSAASIATAQCGGPSCYRPPCQPPVYYWAPPTQCYRAYGPPVFDRPYFQAGVPAPMSPDRGPFAPRDNRGPVPSWGQPPAAPRALPPALPAARNTPPPTDPSATAGPQAVVPADPQPSAPAVAQSPAQKQHICPVTDQRL